MSLPVSTISNEEVNRLGKVLDDNVGSLDVGWLLHSKKGQVRHSPNGASSRTDTNKPDPSTSKAVPAASLASVAVREVRLAQEATHADTINEQVTIPTGKGLNGQPGVARTTLPNDTRSMAVAATDPNTTVLEPQGHKQSQKRPLPLPRTSQQDENRSPLQVGSKGNFSPKQPPRRASWISNLSSKFSSSSGAPSPTRRSSVDTLADQSKYGPASPGLQLNNPLGVAQIGGGAKAEPQKEQEQEDKLAPGPVHQPRRPSVLTQAGKERDDHPGFLQSALRRFSSSSSTGFGKGAGTGQTPQRRVMNVDPNRERVQIADLEPSKLKRVAFCVDVEVAGYASWHEVEEYQAENTDQKAAESPATRRPNLSMLERQAQSSKSKKDKKDAKKDVREAIGKDKAEGGTLKSPQAAQDREEGNKDDVQDQIQPDKAMSQPGLSPVILKPQAVTASTLEIRSSDPQPIPGTRKKEKKKRSEAERKERKERKRRQAEANGQVPLELTGDIDGEDDSSLSPSPPGASTPNMTLSPTTDPLRIYRRCAQLRETTVVKRVCDQISSPSSILAESPGTVAILDLSRTVMTLPELITLGDWLAVVPVRKLLLDDCQLMDEGIRIVLSGLLSCKTAEHGKQNKKFPKGRKGQKGREQFGVIEKVSLKGNWRLTRVGWKHIALFLHMSKSLRAIDLSGLPFPNENGCEVLSRTNTLNMTQSSSTGVSQPSNGKIGSLFARALAERFGANKLEELIMSNCSLSASDIGGIVDAALKCKLRRLGLAENNVSAEGLDHIVRYIGSGVCEGLDLGGNDLHGSMKPISDSFTTDNNLFALSLSGCNLTPSDLQILLPGLVKLKNFLFVDLSNNKGLFSTQPNAVSVLRNYLPQLTSLKRIHLNDVGLSSEHAIALAEILPECPSLAHLSILDNPPITELISSKDAAAQEGACALFASLMTAVRVSRTMVAIDVEVPSAESNEVVKALASQVVAYTLRNLEHGALKELEGPYSSRGAPDKDAPEILLHIVGHMDGYEENRDADEPAPNEDYLMGGNAIVRALGVCLGTAEEKRRATSRNISPSRTPTDCESAISKHSAVGSKPDSHKKPRDMSKELLGSARKIRMRLKPALVREDRAGNDLNYRRLHFLDSTLQRMIQRFEDEYPECKLPASPPEPVTPDTSNAGVPLGVSSYAEASTLSASPETNGLSRTPSGEEVLDDADEPLALRLSRTRSNTTLASKALAHEEGRMHRFGQSVRREIALANDSSNTFPATMTGDGGSTETSRLQALEERINSLCSEDIVQFRQKCNDDGVEKALADFGVTAQELLDLERSDPQCFERFREAQVAARINAGIE